MAGPLFDADMTRLLLAAAVVALGAAGCGSAENDPNLAAAIEKTEAAGSSLFAIEATSVENGKPVPITCSGKADYDRKRLQIACDYDGAADEYEMVAIGSTLYLRGELFGIGRGGSKWVKLTDDVDSLGTQFSPQRLLAMLRRASRETRRVGEEDVRGVETVRYRLEVDCEQAELFDCAGSTAPVEVWIDDEARVRRIRVEEESSSGTIEFYDFGVDAVIEPPPADQVQDLPEVVGPTKCENELGRPITVDQALDATRGHGFSVPTDTDCARSFAAFGNTDAGAGAWEREGQLHCFLYESSQSGAPTSVRRRGADGADAELALHNLECTILADSPTGEEKIDRLEAAVAELERTVRP
jgi:hypothetical protein